MLKGLPEYLDTEHWLEVLPANKALKMISDPELTDCIQRLVSRLG